MNTDVAIPFLDLVTPHVELEEELTALFRRVLHTAGFIGGPMVENFETAFAEFCDSAPCDRREQRHRCAAIRDHGERSAAGRCRV